MNPVQNLRCFSHIHLDAYLQGGLVGKHHRVYLDNLLGYAAGYGLAQSVVGFVLLQGIRIAHRRDACPYFIQGDTATSALCLHVGTCRENLLTEHGDVYVVYLGLGYANGSNVHLRHVGTSVSLQEELSIYGLYHGILIQIHNALQHYLSRTACGQRKVALCAYSHVHIVHVVLLIYARSEHACNHGKSTDLKEMTLLHIAVVLSIFKSFGMLYCLISEQMYANM